MTSDPELIVIVPSRGRPAAAAELAQTFADTCLARTKLLVAVDFDDRTAPEYPDHVARLSIDSHSMVECLNGAARWVLEADRPYAIGFMGDDHRPRTKGWDARYLDVLRGMGTGIVYGDDLLQHERIPTQVAMTSDIVRALGHMAPPSLTHLFVDNYWRDLGQGAGCLAYVPEVVVEHLHPFAHKANWDEGYQRVNAPAMYAQDQEAYILYGYALAADVEKVRALR